MQPIYTTAAFVILQYPFTYYKKYVVKHKSAKLLMTYAVGKLEAGTLMR